MRDPVIVRYVGAMLQAVGLDMISAMDVHNLAAFENAFRSVTKRIEAASTVRRRERISSSSVHITILPAATMAQYR